MAWLKFEEGVSIFPNIEIDGAKVAKGDVATVKQYQEAAKKVVPKGFKSKVTLDPQWLEGSALSFKLEPKDGDDKQACYEAAVEAGSAIAKAAGQEWKARAKWFDDGTARVTFKFKPSEDWVPAAGDDQFDHSLIKRGSFIPAKLIK